MEEFNSFRDIQSVIENSPLLDHASDMTTVSYYVCKHVKNYLWTESLVKGVIRDPTRAVFVINNVVSRLTSDPYDQNEQPSTSRSLFKVPLLGKEILSHIYFNTDLKALTTFIVYYQTFVMITGMCGLTYSLIRRYDLEVWFELTFTGLKYSLYLSKNI